MDKEYHLYMYDPFPLSKKTMGNMLWSAYSVCISVDETESAIQKGIVYVFTVQVCTLRTDLITEHGYRIFVHTAPDDVFEITMGKCARTNREIKPGHNLVNLLLGGEFDGGESDGIIYD